MVTNQVANRLSDEWLTGAVIGQWLEWYQQDLQPVLATIVNIDGSSPRPLGAQMVVASQSQWAGFLSGGCIEPALVAEAVAVQQQGNVHVQRYGAGSPYVDLTLPCGSAIDIYFDPGFSVSTAREILRYQQSRQWCGLSINVRQQTLKLLTAASAEIDACTTHYLPSMRLILAGVGPLVGVLAHLAEQAGVLVEILAFDEATNDLLAGRFNVQRHCSVAVVDNLQIDAFTAVVTLFHEHDREIPILQQALNSDAFYIAALGSQRSHQYRLEHLLGLGVNAQTAQRIHGPAGLFHGARNPRDMAVSILAELLQQHHQMVTALQLRQ